MKVCRFAVLALAALMLSGACGAATEFKNGTAFALGNVPKDLSKWLEVIVWLDLGPSDIWTPTAR